MYLLRKCFVILAEHGSKMKIAQNDYGHFWMYRRTGKCNRRREKNMENNNGEHGTYMYKWMNLELKDDNEEGKETTSHFENLNIFDCSKHERASEHKHSNTHSHKHKNHIYTTKQKCKSKKLK